MSSTAQMIVHRLHAERATGPVTAENESAKPGARPGAALFCVANFVRPEERPIFAEFEEGYFAELSPATPLEQTLTREIIQAAWRLRRCANLESAPPENMSDEELDGLQTSIDRARNAAQRTLYRSLAELRRLQTESLFRVFPRDLGSNSLAASRNSAKRNFANRNFANQSQSQSSEPVDPPQSHIAQSHTAEYKTKPVSIPRGNACPCGSGQKYKRCCGRNAPPMLFQRAS